MIEFTRKSFAVFAILLWSLGVVFGGLFVQKYHLENQDYLPKCEEDEYLYPKDDYLGAGKNKPSDYGCFNFDDQAALGAAVTCQLDKDKVVVCIDNTTGEVLENP